MLPTFNLKFWLKLSLALLFMVALFVIPDISDSAKAALTIPTFGYVTLTESVNKMKKRTRFLRDFVFGKRSPELAPTKMVQADIIIGNQKKAPFVRRGAPAMVVDKLGKKTSLVEPPSIRLKKGLDAEDMLFDRAPGSAIHVVGAGGGNPLDNYRQQRVAREQQDLLDRKTSAEEWMCAQALTGSIAYIGDEVEFSVDMQMPAANKPTLAGGNLWSAATAKPLSNLRTWKTLVQKRTGYLPTMALMTNDVWEAFLANEQVQKYLDNRRINVGNIDTDKAILESGAEMVGKLDNVEFFLYNEIYSDAQGADQNFLAADRFVLVTPNADNRMHYGAISDLDAGTVVGEMFSKDWIEKDPSIYWVLLETHPLPVVHYPETVVYAKVL